MELKTVDFDWRQMEWFGFYFEYKAKELLRNKIDIPGEKYGYVTFDVKGKIDWNI